MLLAFINQRFQILHFNAGDHTGHQLHAIDLDNVRTCSGPAAAHCKLFAGLDQIAFKLAPLLDQRCHALDRIMRRHFQQTGHGLQATGLFHPVMAGSFPRHRLDAPDARSHCPFGDDGHQADFPRAPDMPAAAMLPLSPT